MCALNILKRLGNQRNLLHLCCVQLKKKFGISMKYHAINHIYYRAYLAVNFDWICSQETFFLIKLQRFEHLFGGFLKFVIKLSTKFYLLFIWLQFWLGWIRLEVNGFFRKIYQDHLWKQNSMTGFRNGIYFIKSFCMVTKSDITL